MNVSPSHSSESPLTSAIPLAILVALVALNTSLILAGPHGVDRHPVPAPLVALIAQR